MIEKREILAMAATMGLRPDVIEKDYALGWLLAGIYHHPAIKRTWVFKGGTCLKKCFFETYRFSEDLDFTLTDDSQINEAFLRDTFETMCEWIYEQTGLEIPKSNLSFDIYTNPRGKISCQGKVAYRGPIAPPRSGGFPTIKLDLTGDEKLVLAPGSQPVYHPYSDEPDDGIHALSYVYEEVFGEKFRALAERTRPRDLYDVVNLFRNTTVKPSPSVLLDVLSQKCEFKGISVPVLTDLESHKESLEGSWASMLGHQLPNLPPVESYWSELPAIFDWIEGGLEPVIPTAYPLNPGETIFRERPGRVLTVRQGSQHIEVIRFAAANRLCVELDYDSTTRIIEPYSLRKTQDGNIILHATRSEDDQHRSYRVDRIHGARVTNRVYTPRFEIELAAAGPVVLPPTTASARRTLGKTGSGRGVFSTSLGQKYIFQCAYCQKKFTRSKNNPTLQKHNNNNRMPCSGRRGFLIEIR